MPQFDQENNPQESLESIIAKAIARDWVHIVYDISTCNFAILNTKIMVWSFIEDDEITNAVLAYIESKPEYKTKQSTTNKFWADVTKSLKYRLRKVMIPLPGVMTQDRFFNFETLQAELPSPNQHCFNYIDQPFDVCRTMDKEIVDFLCNLSNHDRLQLNILRLFVKCVLLNKNPAQIVLFLIGPGQTGKSTFSQMLMSLKENTYCTLGLSNLTEKFGLTGLLGANLTVFPDVDPYGLTSKRAGPLKSISAGEPIPITRKYKGTVNYRYLGNLLMHGNSDFELPEKAFRDTTGTARRFIKFPCHSVPKNPDSTLEKRFKANRLQFIWWGLTCPLPCDYWLGKVPTLTETLDQDIEDDVKAFVLDIVRVNPEAMTPVGARETPLRGSLYAAYRTFCYDSDYTACNWAQFPKQLLNTLLSLGVSVSKKRSNKVRLLKGISLTEGNPVPRPDISFVKELRMLDPFELPKQASEEVETSVTLIEEAEEVQPSPETEQPNIESKETEPAPKEKVDSPVEVKSKATKGTKSGKSKDKDKEKNPLPKKPIGRKANMEVSERTPEGKKGP